jgi:hypothetical protein
MRFCCDATFDFEVLGFSIQHLAFPPTLLTSAFSIQPLDFA